VIAAPEYGADAATPHPATALSCAVLRTAAASGAATAGAGYPVPGKDLDLLFQAAIEATEEAILNSLFMAVTTTGFHGHVRHAVSLDDVVTRVGGRLT
jgi:L-aminopeptidase/D-esterase-like protein